MITPSTSLISGPVPAATVSTDRHELARTE
jgi:hypothetical protein